MVMTDATTATAVRDLTKSYGETRAVDGVDLDVSTGEVFALLGPNGAARPRRSSPSRGSAIATAAM
jgi:ABC-type sugar transport system ATPase subunit